MSSKRRTIGLCCLLLGLCAAFSAHAQSADASVGEGMPSTVVAKQGNAIVTLADIDAFAARTGVGVLCNTSLNCAGRGFINRTSDLVEFVRARGIDGFVLDGTVYWSRTRQEQTL